MFARLAARGIAPVECRIDRPGSTASLVGLPAQPQSFLAELLRHGDAFEGEADAGRTGSLHHLARGIHDRTRTAG